MKQYYLNSFIEYVIIVIIFNIIEYYNLVPINIYIQYLFISYYFIGTLIAIIGLLLMYLRQDLAYRAITYDDFTLDIVKYYKFSFYEVYELFVLCLIYKYFNCIEIVYISIVYTVFMDLGMKYAKHILNKYE